VDLGANHERCGANGNVVGEDEPAHLRLSVDKSEQGVAMTSRTSGTPAFAPTTRLRFVERAMSLDAENCRTVRILQQWWAPDVPKYMIDASQGEWRDIPIGIESP
jgi:hypothetical protein